jgi:hypothetical protein
MTMDGEKANDWMAGHHYHDQEVVRAAREVVPLLASAFGEGGVGADPAHEEVDGKCARYGTIPCRHHQEVERAAREALMAEREAFEVPRHIATAPGGRRILHRVFYLSERDLLRLVVRALRVTAPEAALRLARERLRGVLEDLAGADAQVRARGASALALLAGSGDEHAAAILQSLPALGLQAPARLAVASELRPGALTVPETTLVPLLGDPDAGVRRALAVRTDEVAGNPTMLDLLASELPGAEAATRDVLLTALGVERQDDELRVRAARAGNRWRLVEELIGIPAAGRVQGLEALVPTLGSEGRNRVLRALGRRAAADPRSQADLLRCVKGPGGVAALRAIGAAATGPASAPPLVQAIHDAARAADPLLREEALRILASDPAAASVALLAESLEHPSEAVRILAAVGMWVRGDRSGEVVMLGAVRNPEFGALVRSALGR